MKRKISIKAEFLIDCFCLQSISQLRSRNLDHDKNNEMLLASIWNTVRFFHQLSVLNLWNEVRIPVVEGLLRAQSMSYPEICLAVYRAASLELAGAITYSFWALKNFMSLRMSCTALLRGWTVELLLILPYMLSFRSIFGSKCKLWIVLDHVLCMKCIQWFNAIRPMLIWKFNTTAPRGKRMPRCGQMIISEVSQRQLTASIPTFSND